MVVALAMPVFALGLLQVLHQLELWTMRQPLPHDPPPPPGYVDPLEGNDLLAGLVTRDDPDGVPGRDGHDGRSAERVEGADPA